MVRYIKANQTEEFRESNRGLNAKDVWLENFDGTSKSVDYIWEILGIEREDMVEAYIPNGVTKLGEYVFCNCTFLTSITIPDSVTNIGRHAFIGCTSLIITTNNPYVVDFLHRCLTISLNQF